MIALTGEVVGTLQSVKGYNTYGNATGEILAAVCGTVDAVDSVVSIKTASSRYQGENGDVVVGRIKEVSGSRWKVELGAHQDAVLNLANVTEPGGVLRRRGREDEIHMRQIFSEGDVVVCEVQRILPDGTVSLHTRSAEKYGKMAGGCLVIAKPQLVPKTRKHFYTLESCCPNVRVILGVNGYLWVSGTNMFDGNSTREDIARVHNVLTLMNSKGKVLHMNHVEQIVAKSVQLGLTPWDMWTPQNSAALLVVKRARDGGPN